MIYHLLMRHSKMTIKEISYNKRNKKFFISLLFSCITFFPLLSVAQETQQLQKDEILLGMSSAFSGPSENMGKLMLSGIDLGFKHFEHSKESSLNIRVISLDDRYEPSFTISNMYQLIDKENVLAFIGNGGTPNASASVPIINNKKVLFWGAYSGAGILRKNPPDPYIFNYSASYAQSVEEMIKALILNKKLNPTEIAFFTQKDAYGDTGFSSGIQTLKKLGLQDKDLNKIIHVRYERNSLAVENAVAKILLAPNPPKAVILVGVYASNAKFIKLMRDNGMNPDFLCIGIGSQQFAETLGSDGEGVILTQVTPHFNSNVSIAKEYLADKKRFHSTTDPSFIEFEGYIVSRIFSLALEKCKTPLSREGVIECFKSLGQFDIGLETPLEITETKHQACDHIWPMIIKKGRIEPFRWEDLKP